MKAQKLIWRREKVRNILGRADSDIRKAKNNIAKK